MSSTNVYGNNTIESDGVNLYVGTYGGGVYKSTDIHLSAQSNFYQPNFLAVPNPAVDEIILKDLHCISNAAIITQFGQQIPLSQEKISFSHEGLRIDLSELESGIYFLKIDNYLPKRIIISK